MTPGRWLERERQLQTEERQPIFSRAIGHPVHLLEFVHSKEHRLMQATTRLLVRVVGARQQWDHLLASDCVEGCHRRLAELLFGRFARRTQRRNGLGSVLAQLRE